MHGRNSLANNTPRSVLVPDLRKRTSWIAWERHPRNRNLAEALGVELVEYPELNAMGHTARKYLFGLYKTLAYLIRTRPALVIGMYPSIANAVVIVLLRKILRYRAVIDMHNVGIITSQHGKRILASVTKWIIRNADAIIVSNARLETSILNEGGRAIVLSDKLPSFSPEPPAPKKSRFRVVYVTTWSDDDPNDAVIQAASYLDETRYEILVTGRPPAEICESLALPRQVKLTGFVPDTEYQRVLATADAIMVLTTRSDCLVCGAYEATAIHKPMILSDKSILREYFQGGTIFTNHGSQSLADAIMEADASIRELQIGSRERELRIRERWRQEFAVAVGALDELIP